MTQSIPTKKEFGAIHAEINRLRRQDGLEPIGGLAFARKLFSHFREEHNPRVAQALQNVAIAQQAAQ